MPWTIFFTLALHVLPIFSVHSPLTIREAEEPITGGRHIVTLKDGVSQEAHIDAMTNGTSWITHKWDIINGFAGYFSAEDLERLRSHPDVVSIEEDGLVGEAQGVRSQ